MRTKPRDNQMVVSIAVDHWAPLGSQAIAVLETRAADTITNWLREASRLSFRYHACPTARLEWLEDGSSKELLFRRRHVEIVAGR